MKNKLALFFGVEEEGSSLAQILGPLFLISAVMLAAKETTVFNYDLLFVAVFGLFLTAKWKIRGCIAALLLLAFSAGAKHVLFPHNHAWQAGLEGSIGIALLISALVFEESSKTAVSRQSEIERNEKTILFLEDDLSQQKELAAKESAAAVEKQDALRLQLEELQAEVSSIQVLNDVLRKTTAKSIEEKSLAAAQILNFDRREGQLLEEIDSLQKELNRLANESALAQQNSQLFNELNETRVKEAQTHLINETLVRLHAKENQRAREFEAKFIDMEEQIQKSSYDKANDAYEIELLKEQVASLTKTVQTLDEVQAERNALRELRVKLEKDLEKFEEAKIERAALHEHAAKLEQDLEVVRQNGSSASEQVVLKAKLLEEAETERTHLRELAAKLEQELEAAEQRASSETEQFALKAKLLGEVEIERTQLRELAAKLEHDLEATEQRASSETERLALQTKLLEEVQAERAQLRELADELEQDLEAAHQVPVLTDEELEQIALQAKVLEQVQKERDELRALAARLEQDLEEARQKPALTSEEREQLIAQFKTHQTRLEQYAQMELLYRQLKAQFEEKNQILHQTRSQLFHIDTELQTVKQKIREKDLEFEPVSKEVLCEISSIEEENSFLMEEIRELQDLVSHLIDRDGLTSSVKKKMKKLPESAEQASLF